MQFPFLEKDSLCELIVSLSLSFPCNKIVKTARNFKKFRTNPDRIAIGGGCATIIGALPRWANDNFEQFLVRKWLK